MRLRRSLLPAALGLLMALVALSRPALAHPHVWVTINAEILYAPDGTMTGVRNAWTFDEAFSTFALQGLETQPDGKPTETTLKSLAQVNIDSLKEFDYFTVATRGKEKLAFNPPENYRLEYDGTALILHFTLPLAKPAPSKGATVLDVYDPTYFVAFTLADDDPVKLAKAPAGCALTLHRPDPALGASTTTTLSESFFSALTASSSYGSQFTNRATITCP